MVIACASRTGNGVGQPLGGCTLVWQAFDCISPLDNVHEGNPWNLAYTASKFSVTCSDDIAFMGGDTLN